MTSGEASTDPQSPRDLALDELGTGAGELTLGGVAAEELARRFGTPLYVYDAGVVRARLQRVRDALGSRVDVLYALKANPSIAVAATLQAAGAGCEVASAGEIVFARAAGFAGERVQFAGPGKGEADLAAALDHGVGALNLESEAEYELLATMARASGRRPAVAIRVNPRAATSGSRLRMGGGSQRFGVDADDVVPLARRIVAEDQLELRGLHVYAGTQSFDAAAWLGNAAALLALAGEVEADLGRELATLNFGGGFGVPTFAGDPEFDLALAGRGLQRLIATDARPARRYFVELGRYLVATSGVYLTRVRYHKHSGGKVHAVLDGGLHHHGAAAGVGAVLKRPFPIVLARAPRAAATTACTLGGPLCTPADELATDLALPDLERGDLLAVLVSGAYGLSYSQTLFLSHPTPAEVLVDDGRALLVRERVLPAEALRWQTLPMTKTEDPAAALRERVTQLVSRVILQTTGRSVIPEPDEPLFKHGFDPFVVQNLVFALGLEFHVAPSVTELHQHNFGTVNAITAMVARRLPRPS